MLHSIKYKIPAIVVKTRDEALADRRQHVIDEVLANPRLNPNQKMRVFESALYQKLVHEHKLDDIPPPKSISYEPLPEYGEIIPPIYEESVVDDATLEDDTRAAIEDGTRTAIEDDTRTAIENDTTVENDRRESIAYVFNTPKDQKQLKSGFVPVQGDLPSYMQPLKRDSLAPAYIEPLKRGSFATSPVSSRLRENRPPPGHFTGKGRLRVVRW